MAVGAASVWLLIRGSTASATDSCSSLEEEQSSLFVCLPREGDSGFLFCRPICKDGQDDTRHLVLNEWRTHVELFGSGDSAAFCVFLGR